MEEECVRKKRRRYCWGLLCFWIFLCISENDFVWVIFFFQAEDGIRDGRVTGVQTCALAIFIDRVKEVDSLEGLLLDGARLGEPVDGTDTGREVVERCEVRQIAAVAAEHDLT